MTSDERRLEVAASLRASANVGGARTLKRELARALGIRLDDCTPEGSHSKILRGLADLIDLTCEYVPIGEERFGCSGCGYTVELDFDVPVTDETPMPFKHCPNCGAKVVRDGD